MLSQLRFIFSSSNPRWTTLLLSPCHVTRHLCVCKALRSLIYHLGIVSKTPMSGPGSPVHPCVHHGSLRVRESLGHIYWDDPKGAMVQMGDEPWWRHRAHGQYPEAVLEWLKALAVASIAHGHFIRQNSKSQFPPREERYGYFDIIYIPAPDSPLTTQHWFTPVRRIVW